MSNFSEAEDNRKESKIDWEKGKTILITGADDEGLYSYQLKEARSLIQRIVERGPFSANSKGTAASHSNTVIGVSGERGSGKTSFLYSLDRMLPDEVCSLGIVEPSSFSSNMNALEIFLAQVYSKYKEIIGKVADEVACARYQTRLNVLLKKIIGSLSTLRVNRSVYASENISTDILSNMSDLQEMRASIKKLCEAFLDLVNLTEANKTKRQALILLFDDVDLTGNHDIYRLLEDVRKYLSGNLVVIISYRQRQLFDSVLDSMIRENENLLKNGAISLKQIKGRAEDFIVKVVQNDRVINLYDQANLLNERILDVVIPLAEDRQAAIEEIIDEYQQNYAEKLPFDMEFKQDMTVMQWLDAALYCKTLMTITPVNTQENVPYLWPRNLRELVSFAQLVHEAMWFPHKQQNEFGQHHDNLLLYRNYYIANTEEALEPQMLDALGRWTSARVSEKNYVAYAGVFEFICEIFNKDGKTQSSMADAVFDDLLNIALVYPENVSIGDVYLILDRYMNASFGNEISLYFGNAFKTLYSIELLSLILRMISEYIAEESVSQKTQNEYLMLLNSSVLPPELSTTRLSQEIYSPTKDEWARYLEENKKRADSLPTELSSLKQDLAWFVSPSAAWDSQAFLSSRPQLVWEERSDSLVQKTKYFSNYNRRIFSYGEGVLEEGEGQELLRGGLNYCLCLLNIVATKNYLDAAISNVVVPENATDSGRNEYLFYALSDLDVFTRMTFEEKKGSEKILANQMKRINAALAYSSSKSGEVDAAGDDTILTVKISYEKALFAKIKTPFITSRDGSYRLFKESSSDQRSIVTEFGLLEGLFASFYKLAVSVPLSEISEEMDRCGRTKTGILKIAHYADLLAERIENSKASYEREEKETAQDAEERLAKYERTLESLHRVAHELSLERTRYIASRKKVVDEAIQEYPEEARLAYRSWGNE